jgi:hypothetical protein
MHGCSIFEFFYVKLGIEWSTVQLDVRKFIRDVLGNVDFLSKANWNLGTLSGYFYNLEICNVAVICDSIR